MGIITVKLSDRIEAELRRKAALVYGATRGSLSRAVEDAIKLWLRSTAEPRDVKFYAYRNGEKVAEARSLAELAQTLKSLGLSVRDVTIVSSDEPEYERLGLRARRG